jgi:hypothetical protein
VFDSRAAAVVNITSVLNFGNTCVVWVFFAQNQYPPQSRTNWVWVSSNCCVEETDLTWKKIPITINVQTAVSIAVIDANVPSVARIFYEFVACQSFDCAPSSSHGGAISIQGASDTRGGWSCKCSLRYGSAPSSEKYRGALYPFFPFLKSWTAVSIGALLRWGLSSGSELVHVPT